MRDDTQAPHLDDVQDAGSYRHYHLRTLVDGSIVGSPETNDNGDPGYPVEHARWDVSSGLRSDEEGDRPLASGGSSAATWWPFLVGKERRAEGKGAAQKHQSRYISGRGSRGEGVERNAWLQHCVSSTMMMAPSVSTLRFHCELAPSRRLDLGGCQW